MKNSVLLSVVTVGISAFVGDAKAQYNLDIPSSLSTCLAGAPHGRAEERCYAIHNCMRNYSDDVQSLRDCHLNVETAYRASFSSPTPGAAPVSATSSAIVTGVADSDYSMRDGQKGFLNAQQGN
jgi:hypothetical protein